MAIAEEFVRGAAGFRVDRNADADLDAMLASSRRKRPIEGPRDALGKLRGRRRKRGAGNGNGELVATEARHQAFLPGLFSQSFRHGLQHAIAAGVPNMSLMCWKPSR